jgi:hypothetical protein
MKGYSDILRGSYQGSKEQTAFQAKVQQPPRSVTRWCSGLGDGSMLAPFIVALLIASALLILVGWASDAVSASMLGSQRHPNSAVEKGWNTTIPLRTALRYDISSATWNSRLVPAVTAPARLALCTPGSVRRVPRSPEQRPCPESRS